MRQQPTGMHHFFVHPILGSAKVFLVSLLSQIFGIPKNPQDLESSMPMVESWNHPCQWWNHGIIHANGGIMESSMPMVESWNHPCQWWNHGIIHANGGIMESSRTTLESHAMSYVALAFTRSMLQRNATIVATPQKNLKDACNIRLESLWVPNIPLDIVHVS